LALIGPALEMAWSRSFFKSAPKIPKKIWDLVGHIEHMKMTFKIDQTNFFPFKKLIKPHELGGLK